MKATKWRIVLTVVIALIITISFSGCTVGKGKVAVFRLSGIIADSSQQGLLITGGISPKQVRDYLGKAESDGGVKAVVLRIDSPGGAAAASQEIASEVRHFKEVTGKPVVISMGDVAASGGYYISAYADRIVANPSTLTGSIGVISQFIYIEGLLEKLGLELETIKTGKHKDMGIWPLSEEQRQIMQDITDDLYEQFVAAVAEGRGLPVAEVRQLATGQLYTGVQALNLGLVDKLGGLETAIELASSLAGITTPEIEEYSPPASFFEKLLGGLAPPSLLPLSEDELLFLRMLEGWQGMPRY
ncbi:putative signal peptide peptidase SppA [subsurface metagenome]